MAAKPKKNQPYIQPSARKPHPNAANNPPVRIKIRVK